MADEDHEENFENEEEDEEWTEPVDLSEMKDGNSTAFVGGFSSLKTIGQALEVIKSNKDRIVVMKGTYDAGDVSLDTTKYKGLSIEKETNAATNDVQIVGKLVLNWSKPQPGAQEDAEEEEKAVADEPALDEDGNPIAQEGEGEGGDGEDVPVRKPKQIQPKLLTINGLTFFNGAEVNAQAVADVIDCAFGCKNANLHSDVHTVQVHGFATTNFNRCKIYGSQKTAVYAFPRTKAVFDRCDIIGCEKIDPQAAPVKHKRGYVPPPPPPPTAPQKCLCEVGAFCDDSTAIFKECTFSHFDIGIFTRDVCKGTRFDRCALSLIASVGILVDTGSEPAVRNSVAKLCRRECVVVGDKAHPTLRDNVFVGDVRLKRGAVATGMSDNVLGLKGNLWDDGGIFALKGFTVVENDPTAPKPKKLVKADD